MDHHRLLAGPGLDEADQLLHVLGRRQDVAVERVHDVAHPEEQVALGADGGRPLHGRAGVDQGHDVARARRGDRVVQVGQWADVQGRHGLSFSGG
jgi:hypothetical protein